MFKNKLFIAVSLLAVSSLSYAYPNHDPNVYDNGNLWEVKVYNDSSVSHNPVGSARICFLPYTPLGTHIRGKWYSTTWQNPYLWTGYYQQEGDEVKLFGNFSDGKGNDSASFDIVTRRSGAGHWVQWLDSGWSSPTDLFLNAAWEKVGKCKVPKTFNAALAQDIPPRYLLKGGVSGYPFQEAQVPLEGKNKLEELFPSSQIPLSLQ